MGHLGRIRLFVRTIRTFLTNLKRHHGNDYASLGDLVLHYDKKSDGAFAVKPTESAKKLVELGDDSFYLVERFKEHESIARMDSYKHLVRLFTEQCIVEKDDNDNSNKVVIRASKDISSDSLQNPSDPDAGYCGHKGKGYQMQVMETYSKDKSQPNLITHIKVESANQSDANALIPAIEDAQSKELAPTELLADTLYGSDSNIEQAKELGVTVIAPVMGKKEGAMPLSAFTFDDNNLITACPEQQVPQRIKSDKGVTTVIFNKALCDVCPRQSECLVKREKKNCTLTYDDKAVRLTRRRAEEKSDEFKDSYRYRSGVEGTMSDLDRMTGLKHLRVRGMPQVCLAATMKATGLNILRIVAFKNRLKRPKKANKRSNPSLDRFLDAVKEQFRRMWNYFGGRDFCYA